MNPSDIILQQLGGRRFIVMTGAKNFTYSKADGGNNLSFAIPTAKQGINRVEIILTPMDVYTVKFWKFNGKKFTADVVREYEDVYAEDLQERFTEATGLDTHL